MQSSDLVVFCHDFQNNKCPRINCKFLHYTIDEEEHYRKYGEFLIHQGSTNGGDNNDFSNSKNLINGVGCKNYSDSSGADYSSEYSGFFNNSNSSNGNRTLPSLLDSELFNNPCQQQRMEACHCHNDRGFSNGTNSFRNNLKRMNNSQDREFLQQAPNFKRSREDELMTVLRRFEEEHLMLKRRVEANELKIAELRASNEYLMTQNAQLRISTVQVSRVVNPVTVTQTQSQQSTPVKVINATMAPIVSMATPTQTIITTPPNASGINYNNNNINVGQPIAIHTTTNASQQQILGTSQITLAPAPIGLSINTSQALQAAISNATQPIISYPIMTHSILPH